MTFVLIYSNNLPSINIEKKIIDMMLDVKKELLMCKIIIVPQVKNYMNPKARPQN